MKEKKWPGILLCLLLVAAVISAGCSGGSGETPASTTVPAPATAIKYSAGDVIAKTDSGNEDHLYVIIKYDPATDKYTRAWIYKNSDGSWGHFIDNKTDESTRTIIEKVYPVRVAQVTVSSVPVIAPTAAVVTTITYTGSGPVVSGISPKSGARDGSVTVTITGSNFETGAIPKLLRPGSGMVTGSSISVSSGMITTTFNLAGKDSGKYNVVVSNPNGQSGTLQNAFAISEAGPSITDFFPRNEEINDTIDSFKITGKNFNKESGVKVSFVLGSTEIGCSSVIVYSDTEITCIPGPIRKSNNWQIADWEVRVQNIGDAVIGTASQKLTISNSTIIKED